MQTLKAQLSLCAQHQGPIIKLSLGSLIVFVTLVLSVGQHLLVCFNYLSSTPMGFMLCPISHLEGLIHYRAELPQKEW